MDPLPHEPRTFREIVEADLRRAARLIIKTQAELAPQLRIATPEGDYAIALTLPADGERRSEAFRHLGVFMAWKSATAFTWASELLEPDALYCAGVSRTERHACIARIDRVLPPLVTSSFGPVEWLPVSALDPTFVDLLPIGLRTLTPKAVSSMVRWFGKEGKFPAVHVATGEVRGA